MCSGGCWESPVCFSGHPVHVRDWLVQTEPVLLYVPMPVFFAFAHGMVGGGAPLEERLAMLQTLVRR